MYLVTGKEMAEIDRLAISEWGIPEVVLMENAGLQVVGEIKNQYPNLQGKKAVIVVGKGNNGGDGLVIARHLSNLGVDVKVFLLGKKGYQGAALINYQIAQKFPIKWHTLENENNLHLLKLTLHYTDILVDAIFGTGFKGPAKEMAANVIEVMNESQCIKFAVDIPSGLDAETGTAPGPCVQADYTVTFALPKLGLMLQSGEKYAGKIKVVDISIPTGLIEELNLEKQLITKDMIKNSIPWRSRDSHKGSYGHLLVVGGSMGMMGAVHLASRGGFALGAGLVTAGVPGSIQASLASSLPELMTQPLAETAQGTLGIISGPDIINSLQGKTAVVLGPGLGRHQEIVGFVKWLIEQLAVPVVIDADGLNSLAEDMSFLQQTQIPIVITPHPGEMARLMGVSSEEVQADRIYCAQAVAQDYGIWVVLKGNKTVIATPAGQIFLNPTGGPALATAGTGDVLAGMIGAMLGQEEDITQAICTAVYIHGLAGEEVAGTIGEISSKASDVVQYIPEVLRKLVE